MLSKIKKLFFDEHDDTELREMRTELRRATAECAALVSGIRYYASKPDSQESRQCLLDLANTSRYGETYLQYVDRIEGELRRLKGGGESES